MKPSASPPASLLQTLTALLFLPLCIIPPPAAAQTTHTNSSSSSSTPKRGLIAINTEHPRDLTIFSRPNSPLTWYYNYSPWPTSELTSWTTLFTPMIHSAGEASGAVDTIKAVVNGSAGIALANTPSEPGNRITHVLTFNEPDGDTASGGSDATPRHAAEVYIAEILPLRSPPWNLRVGLPATTGSPRGLAWLRDFNESCFALRPADGCAFDFLATHWYGDRAGLADWLGQLHALYPHEAIWVTEFAIAALDADATRAFMNQTLPYLDGLEYVERYAWFGAFREDDANEWTGDGVSLLDDRGGLTELGATYLGGEAEGFEEGTGDGAAGGVELSRWLLVGGLVLGLLGYAL